MRGNAFFGGTIDEDQANEFKERDYRVSTIVAGLIVLLLVFFAALLIAKARRRSSLRTFNAVAARFLGEVQVGAGAPSVAFTHACVPAILDFGERGIFFGRRALRLRIVWPDDRMWCDVRPRAFGWSPISSGDEEFDKLYHARGAPREQVELLLSAAVRICINQLRFLYDSTNIHLRIQGGELTVSKRGLSRSPTTVIRFAELGLELYDQAMLLHSAGLTFVTDSPAGASKTAVSDGAVCRVCGEELHGAIVLCRNCRTPCHRDCWKYFGGCATYGCGGRKCQSAKAAARGA